MPTRADLKRRAAIAWGIALICAMFLLETIVAHHAAPNPASPWVWTALGSVAAAAVVRALWLQRRMRDTAG